MVTTIPRSSSGSKPVLARLSGRIPCPIERGMIGSTRSDARATMSVEDFVTRKVRPEYRDIVAALRTLMRECAPQAREIISYGVPMYRQRRTLAVISPTRKGITFAFSRGAQFEDKYGLLEGVGKVSKNVRMKNLEDVNHKALRYYIRQALEFDNE
jgi:hypothetical protein